MLQNTLAAAYVPGTNLKWNVAGGNWSYLLPSRELDQVVSLGRPPATTLETLASIGRHGLVICEDGRQLYETACAIERLGISNLALMVLGEGAGLPLPEGSVDLLFVAGRRFARQLSGERAGAVDIARLLKQNGLVYCEFAGPLDPHRQAREVGREMGGLHPVQLLWLTPRFGEMQTAVPLDDGETIGYFLRHALFARATQNPLLRPAERIVGQYLAVHQWTRRYGLLLSPSSEYSPNAPPRYVRTIAADAGVDLEGLSWGLVASGEYQSRKVLMYLCDRSTGSPTYIVKMARKPGLNSRLENACRSLEWLERKGVGDGETVPRVVFTGCHQGLRIVGETVIQGVPFSQRARWTADCPYLRAAARWLTELGAATVETTASTEALGQTFEQLLGRVAEIYTLSPEEQNFLSNQVAKLRKSPGPLPLVFQHGDPGAWNAMVTLTGRFALLDWEAGEPQGIPLWDLLYFLRSYGVRAARTRGVRNRLRGFSQQFLAASPFGSVVVDVTQNYCERLSIPRKFIEPLFYGCWMLRALKEAPRLKPEELDDGHFISLLRLCIRECTAPTLVRLFHS